MGQILRGIYQDLEEVGRVLGQLALIPPGLEIPLTDQDGGQWYVSIVPNEDGPGLTWAQAQVVIAEAYRVLWGYSGSAANSWLSYIAILNGEEETSPQIGYAIIGEGTPPSLAGTNTNAEAVGNFASQIGTVVATGGGGG